MMKPLKEIGHVFPPKIDGIYGQAGAEQDPHY